MSLWEYRATVFTIEPDLTGFDVEATDGHIGKVDESSNDAGRSFLVVDTGFWIFGKKRLIPAGVVERVDPDAKALHVGLTKEQIKSAPDFDEVQRASSGDYERHYQKN
jgi:hypothetical protein